MPDLRYIKAGQLYCQRFTPSKMFKQFGESMARRRGNMHRKDLAENIKYSSGRGYIKTPALEKENRGWLFFTA